MIERIHGSVIGGGFPGELVVEDGQAGKRDLGKLSNSCFPYRRVLMRGGSQEEMTTRITRNF